MRWQWTDGGDVGVAQMPAAAAAAMLGNYGPLLTYASAAAGPPAAYMSAAGTILLAAAAPPGSSMPLCTVLLVSNLNEQVRRSSLHCTLPTSSWQVCVEPPASAVNMTLPRICCWAPAPSARRPQLSIDISCVQGGQLQTRRQSLLLSIDGRDRPTDGRTLDRYVYSAAHRPTMRSASINRIARIA